MEDYQRSFSVYSEVHARTTFTYQELAPLLDALNDQIPLVYPLRFDPPAAGGGPDVALTLSFLVGPVEAVASAAAVLFAGGFFKKMGEDSWTTVREQARRLMKREKERDAVGRQLEPFAIRFEGIKFVFTGEVGDEEFRKRLAKAGEYIESLPPSALLPRFRPPEYGWCYWDEEAQSWRGSASKSLIEQTPD